MKTTIIIPTRDRSVMLKQCLSSLMGQTHSPDEIIIIDSSSFEKPKIIVDVFSKKMVIHYVRSSTRNIALARNEGVKRAHGDIIIFIDDDCVADSNWLSTACSYFAQNNLVALIGVSKNIKSNSFIAQTEQLMQEKWFSEFYSIHTQAVIDSGIFFNSRNLAVRKKFLVKHRLFFDTKCPYKIEDTDFGIRFFQSAKKENKQILYSPDMVIYHQNSSSVKEFIMRRWYAFCGYKWLEAKYRGLFDFKKKLPLRHNSIRENNMFLWVYIIICENVMDYFFRNIYSFL